MKLNIKVIPGANRPGIAGWLDETTLKLKVAAPAEKGKANRAAEQLLSQSLSVPARSVHVISGHTVPRKVVEIEDLSLAQVRERLRME